MAQRLSRPLFRFGRDERGGIIVEFSIIMPLMLLFFGVTVESARMMWSYQTAIAGVRDAGRYLARTTPSDICITAGSVSDRAAALRNIVENDISGNALFPARVTVNSVTPSYTCVTGTYRVSPAAVGIVTASITLDFPLANIMSFFGSNMTTVTTTIADQSRIFGQ